MVYRKVRIGDTIKQGDSVYLKYKDKYFSQSQGTEGKIAFIHNCGDTTSFIVSNEMLLKNDYILDIKWKSGNRNNYNLKNILIKDDTIFPPKPKGWGTFYYRAIRDLYIDDPSTHNNCKGGYPALVEKGTLVWNRLSKIGFETFGKDKGGFHPFNNYFRANLNPENYEFVDFIEDSDKSETIVQKMEKKKTESITFRKFKEGDWVVGWFNKNTIDEYHTLAWQIGEIKNGYVYVKDKDSNTDISTVRLASKEEIKQALFLKKEEEVKQEVLTEDSCLKKETHLIKPEKSNYLITSPIFQKKSRNKLKTKQKIKLIIN